MEVKRLGAIVIVANVRTKMATEITSMINGIDESRPNMMAPRNARPLGKVIQYFGDWLRRS